MKKKKIFWILPVIILVIIVCGSLVFKNLTSTTYAKLDTKFGIMSAIQKMINPILTKGKSVNEIREVLHNNTTKWSNKSIPFTNIKNISVKINSSDVPVRVYTPDNTNNLPVIIYSHGGKIGRAHV